MSEQVQEYSHEEIERMSTEEREEAIAQATATLEALEKAEAEKREWAIADAEAREVAIDTANREWVAKRNTRLIAAAPEMVGVLRRLVEVHSQHNSGPEAEWRFRQVAIEACDALAKAGL